LVHRVANETRIASRCCNMQQRGAVRLADLMSHPCAASDLRPLPLSDTVLIAMQAEDDC